MPSKPSQVDPQWSLAHLMLLSKFATPRDAATPTSDHWADQWTGALGETESEAIRRFIGAGLLTPCTLSERLACRFSSAELKRMLGERHLKVSGRKEEMAERLSNADPLAMERAVVGAIFMRCYERGLHLANAFIAYRNQMQTAALKSLRQGYADSAYQVVCDFQDALGFPEAPMIQSKPDLGDLRRVFSVKPKILASVSGKVLEELRVAAGMAFLGLASNWLPEDLDTGMAMDCDAAVNMIIAQVQNARNIESFRLGGVSKIKILCSQDGPCEACSALRSRIWPLDAAPEIPYEHCTSACGCRCVCVADFAA